jgi:hypothetical protein
MGKGGNVKSVNILCPSSCKIEEEGNTENLYLPFLQKYPV